MRTQINENVNAIRNVGENKLKNKSLQQFLPLLEADTQGLLHPAQVNVG
jgi:hypothetical protein